MHQLIQLSGALLVLAGFVLVQRGVVDSRSRAYLALNLVGAAVLAVDAWLGAQWGFFVLESTWSVVSAGGLVAVKPFMPRVLGALSRETLAPPQRQRFESSLTEKVDWFGSRPQLRE